jgi:hypothetical protein
VSSPRPVRIPRGPRAPRVAASLGDLVDHRPNTAGTQRAFRFAVVYVVALLILDLILVALDLTSSEASSPGLQGDLRLFLAIAALLAVGSVIFALSPAPRFVDVRTGGVVVVGRWGGRAGFPPLGQIRPQVLRHYPGGFLSSKPVDMVRLVDQSGRQHTYQVESGLFANDSDAASP